MDLCALWDRESVGLGQIGCECEGDRAGILVWVPLEADPEA